MEVGGRQTLAPLSTAESELQEGIEGMTMGDSCDVLIMEVESAAYQKILKVDNQAAVNLLTEPSGEVGGRDTYASEHHT